jgi:cytochrome c-type biogenesis protein CcmH/NrfF
VSEFGEAVLAAPPARGFGLLAWLLPLFGLAGSGRIGVLARRWARPTLGPTKPVHADSASELDPNLVRRLDEELALFAHAVRAHGRRRCARR